MEKNSSKNNILITALLAIIVVATLGTSIITFSSGASNSNSSTTSSAGKESEKEKNNGKNQLGTASNKNKDKDKDSDSNSNVVITTDNKDKNKDKTPGGNSKPDDGDTSVGTGEISLVYTEATNGISLKDAMPIDDSVGKVLSKSNEVFEFSIDSKMSSNTNVDYEIAIIKDPSSTLANNEVRLYLTQVIGGSEYVVNGPMNFSPISTPTSLGSPTGSMVMAKVRVSSSANHKYKLRMWVASGTNINSTSKTYKVKVNVYGKASM